MRGYHEKTIYTCCTTAAWIEVVMSELVRRAFVLGFARIANYAVLLISPLLLVRLLDVDSYGQYREFILYSLVLISICGLAIKDNLIYIVPKYPERAAIAASQTANMLLVATLVGLAIFVLGKDWFLSRASFDFALPLALYVFFFLGHDILENYWLGVRQPGYVLLYSTARSLFRLVVVVVAALTTQSVQVVIIAIVCAEGVRWVASILILLRLGLLPLATDRVLAREQLRFIAPLSAAGLIYLANEKVGHLFVSATLGAGALAVYTIGTYQLPVIAVVRSAVADTLFPEMVKHSDAGSNQGLEMWKASTVFYLVLVLPLVVVLMYLSELFVVTLFTVNYIEAVDVFRFALLIMIRQCFEVGTPLRAINANRYMLQGNLAALALHLPLLYVAVHVLGIAGAALAWVVADLIAAGYLGRVVLRRYGITVAEFARWRAIGKIVACALVASPVMLLGDIVGLTPWLAGLVSASLYGCAYLMILSQLRVSEVEVVLKYASNMFRKRFL